MPLKKVYSSRNLMPKTCACGVSIADNQEKCTTCLMAGILKKVSIECDVCGVACPADEMEMIGSRGGELIGICSNCASFKEIQF